MKFHKNARLITAAFAFFVFVTVSGCQAEVTRDEALETSGNSEFLEEKPEEPAVPEDPPVTDEGEEEAEPEHSIDDPKSIWVVSNKHRPLNPIDYEPDDLRFPEGVENVNGQPLREEVASAVENLIFAAADDGVHIFVQSAYRPYWMQQNLFSEYVARDGEELADRYSARPGHSEHQTGLVVDLNDYFGCTLNQCFESTPAGMWLQERASEFGFIIRYPDGYEHITGFIYEPWHYRYVGPELAVRMKDEGVLTLEEWFGLDPAPTYL